MPIFKDWWRNSDTCYIRPWDGANARFLDFTEIAKIAQMNPGDLLTLKMVKTDRFSLNHRIILNKTLLLYRRIQFEVFS